MRVLLTGAAGFIGGHIRSSLIAAGHEVIGADGMLCSAHGPGRTPPAGVRALDVRDRPALTAALRGVDAVCHQAAVVGAGVDASDAPAYASHNDLGTAVLLAAMNEAGCSRLVLASSMVVYGDGRYRCARHGVVTPPPRTPTDLRAKHFDRRCPVDGELLTWDTVAEDAPLLPRSTYAASKVAQENYALAWSVATGGSVIALRYHNVYGPHMPRDSPYSGVAAMFRSALESGRAPKVFEDGRQARDFVHVTDVARANRLAIEADIPGCTPLNIASGVPVSIGEVAEAVAAAHGGPAPVVTGDFRPGDVRHIVASPQRAVELLGFRAAIAPAQGLRAFAHEPLREAGSVTNSSG